MAEVAQIIGIIRDIILVCVLVFVLIVLLRLNRRLLSVFESLDKLTAKLNDLSDGKQMAYNFGKVISFVAVIFGKRNKD